MKIAFRNSLRAVVLAAASLGIAGAAQAQWHGGYRHGGGGWHGAPWVWGGVGLGLGLGLASSYAWSQPYYAPYYTPPTYVYSAPAVVYTQPAPVPASYPSGSNAQPVVYPRNGQSAAQLESDSDQCSQWAGQQPNATADRSVFNRGVAACMDARGYTLR